MKVYGQQNKETLIAALHMFALHSLKVLICLAPARGLLVLHSLE